MAGPVAARAEVASLRARGLPKRAIPLVVVPYMGESGRHACEAARVPWMDLSGNAHIVAPGLRIIVDGRPNQFKSPGRPSSVFAPKSARIVRWMLMHPAESFTQRELALATDMTEGYVSRIVSRLEEENYILRGGASGEGEHAPRSRLRVRDATILLDAWKEQYRFSKHHIIRGHVASRSGDALTRAVSDALASCGIEHAATGLSAAWQFTSFAAFRTATFFVKDDPSVAISSALGFRAEPRGSNLWFAVPNDEGVFQGSESRDGVRCVHPIQAFLDLQEHPERAPEAAEHLYANFINPNQHG
jgi:hypothetical protein